MLPLADRGMNAVLMGFFLLLVLKVVVSILLSRMLIKRRYQAELWLLKENSSCLEAHFFSSVLRLDALGGLCMLCVQPLGQYGSRWGLGWALLQAVQRSQSLEEKRGTWFLLKLDLLPPPQPFEKCKKNACFVSVYIPQLLMLRLLLSVVLGMVELSHSSGRLL